MNINTELKRLAEYRLAVDKTRQLIVLEQAQLEETPQYVQLMAKKEVLKSLITVMDSIDANVRELALQEWEKSDKTSKKFKGFSVSEKTVVTLLDERKAKIWAATNAPSTVSLAKSFDKAIANLELDFVQVGKEASIGIASDLSEFLNDENNS